MRTNCSGERVLSTPRLFRKNISLWLRPRNCRAEPEPERYPDAHCLQGPQIHARFGGRFWATAGSLCVMQAAERRGNDPNRRPVASRRRKRYPVRAGKGWISISSILAVVKLFHPIAAL